MIFSGLFNYLIFNYKTIENIFLQFNMIDRLNIIKLEKNYLFRKEKEYPNKELSRLEKASIGFNLNYDLFKNVYQNKKATLLDILEKYQKTGIYECVCQIEQIKEITTKKQEKMAFMEVNSKNKYEVVIFAKEYQKNKLKLNNLINELSILKLEIKNDKIIFVEIKE